MRTSFSMNEKRTRITTSQKIGGINFRFSYKLDSIWKVLAFPFVMVFYIYKWLFQGIWWLCKKLYEFIDKLLNKE